MKDVRNHWLNLNDREWERRQKRITELIQELRDSRWDEIERKERIIDELAQFGEAAVQSLCHDRTDKHFGADECRVYQRVGYPANAAVIPRMLEYLQDLNWPAAHEAFDALLEIGEILLPFIREIFQTYYQDDPWIYGLCCLLERIGAPTIDPLVPDLLEVMKKGTEGNELDLAALIPLRKVGSPKADAAIPIIDVIRNTDLGSSSQTTLAVTNTQIVQTRGGLHETISAVGMGIAQCVFNTTRPLDARHRVFDPHPHARQGAIAPLLARRQRLAPRLFFGGCICSTGGAYP